MSGALHKQQIVASGTDDFMLTRVYDIVRDAPFPDDIGERILRNDFTATWHGREDEARGKQGRVSRALDAAPRRAIPSCRLPRRQQRRSRPRHQAGSRDRPPAGGRR